MTCPLWSLHIVFLYILVMCPVWLLCSSMAAAASGTTVWWNVTFHPDRVSELVEGTRRVVHLLTYEPLGTDFEDGTLEIAVTNPQVLALVTSSGGGGMETENTTWREADSQIIYLNASSDLVTQPLNLSFVLQGRFLGYSDVQVKATSGPRTSRLYRTSEDSPSIGRVLEGDSLWVSVKRAERMVDTLFIAAVGVLMGINYVNMGSSLDLDVIKSTLKVPLGPAVGLFCQYIFMPLMSFGLSYLCFSLPALRLGLFTSGCSPGGGASNMWTYLLKGNLNLSITMTFFSNVFAFATMPFWLFTLGRVLFQETDIKIPYVTIVTILVGLVVPVGIGILIQLYWPRMAAVCRRILKPFSIAMIIFIVVFGIYTNLWMFQVFSLRIFFAGLSVPLMGYLFGALAGYLLRFSTPDITAISIETGVQNTGLAIMLLRVSLTQPEADLLSVIPVALATMTPFPLLLALIVIHVRERIAKRNKKYTLAPTSSPTPSDEEAQKVPTTDNDVTTSDATTVAVSEKSNGHHH